MNIKYDIKTLFIALWKSGRESRSSVQQKEKKRKRGVWRKKRSAHRRNMSQDEETK